MGWKRLCALCSSFCSGKTDEFLRILFVDDHKLFREGLTALLHGVQETAVVGEAATGAEAIAQAETVTPDVILMDIQMPDGDGIAVTVKTVRNHVSNIFSKLQVVDRAQAAIRAREVGLG